MTQAIKLLELLQKRKRAGVTFDDFPRGFRLAAVIFVLREKGHQIITHNEKLGECVRARYVLIKKA